jgi:translation initiation factor IF-3
LQQKINGQITAREIKLVSSDGKQLGLMSLAKALQMAKDDDLDLVQVSYSTPPFVCRIMDYGKQKYEQSKKKTHTKVSELREIRVKPNIAENDLQVKLRQVKKFLNDGDKVKITVVFKGRELAHFDIGWKVLQKITEDLKGLFVIEKQPIMEGTKTFMILAPPKKIASVKMKLE